MNTSPSLTATRLLAEHLAADGVAVSIGTDALSFGCARIAVDIAGRPCILDAIHDGEELSWTVTDPYDHSTVASVSLFGVARAAEACEHIHRALAMAGQGSNFGPEDSVDVAVQAALTSAGIPFELWANPSSPIRWLSIPTADGGEIDVSSSTHLAGPIAAFAGLRAEYSPVAGQDGGEFEALVYRSPQFGHRGGGTARFAAELHELVTAVAACRRLAEARHRWLA
ncbi:hypothetical protein ACFWXO_30850 [Kitasatospora sp. NPDC059088]|uniref:hypothetical protein n=1 Tax=Kitasatospora sp. NPDC059088 TaxID=3346722 RepID=UPI00367DD801